MNTAAVASELTALIKERHIDPDTVIDHTYLASYADGTVSLPFANANASAMLVLANITRTEPWYWYNLAGVPLPKTLISTLQQRASARDASRERTRQKQIARKAARKAFIAANPDAAPKLCHACNVTKPAAAFYRGHNITCRECVKARSREYYKAKDRE